MINYNRGLFKQLEDLTLENESLKKENKSLKSANKELRQRIDNLENSIDQKIAKALSKATLPLQEQLKNLEIENERKDSEIKRLKTQHKKDSTNSSKPNSTNGFKKIPNSRDKSDKKVGGQQGHKGSTLKVPNNLESLLKSGKAQKQVVDFTNGAHKYVSKWKIDLETLVVYTEYRYPLGAKPCTFYGENLKALSVLLSNDGLVAEGRLSDFFKSISHNLISISKSTIDKFNTEAAEKVDLSSIKEALLNGAVLHTDETPMKCTQVLKYGETTPLTASRTSFNITLRTHSNETATLYTVNPHKDDEGVRRDGIIPFYCGILVHDHDKKYYKYGTLHATCGAHLARELKGLFELYKIQWADRFRRFYIGINDYKNQTEWCEPAKLSEFEHTYDALLSAGNEILNDMAPKSFGYDVLRPILKRLRDYKNAYLLFIRDYTAPFTNNQAERDLRPCKTKQKVSGCFRSWYGVIRYAKIRSFIATAKKRSDDLFDSIKALFDTITFRSAEQ